MYTFNETNKTTLKCLHVHRNVEVDIQSYLCWMTFWIFFSQTKMQTGLRKVIVHNPEKQETQCLLCLDKVPRNKQCRLCLIFCKVSVTNLTYKMFANEHYTHYGAPTDRLKFNCRNIVFPFRTPAMAGGLFSIHREFFDYLGGYDRGMRIWGAENLAMSFKVSLVFIDCQKSKPMSVLEVAFCRIHQYFPT